MWILFHSSAPELRFDRRRRMHDVSAQIVRTIADFLCSNGHRLTRQQKCDRINSITGRLAFIRLSFVVCFNSNSYQNFKCNRDYWLHRSTLIGGFVFHFHIIAIAIFILHTCSQGAYRCFDEIICIIFYQSHYFDVVPWIWCMSWAWIMSNMWH